MLRHQIRRVLKASNLSQRRNWGRSPAGSSQTRRLVVESLESRLLLAPVIGTSRSPVLPAAANSVLVSSTVTDSGSSLTNVNLAYETSAAGTTGTVFTETFGTGSQVKPWSGTAGTGYADNAWTVTGSYCELNPNANDGAIDTAANSRGMTYKGQTTANTLTGAMMATSVNAAGMSGYVQFYFDELTLSGTDGWAFQLDPTGTGNSYTTCASDSTFKYNNLGWQTYDYPLTGSQLVNGLKMRFQFSGGGSGDSGRIYLDHITVAVTSFNTATATTLPMSYANGTYGATIPRQDRGYRRRLLRHGKGQCGLHHHRPSNCPDDDLFLYGCERADPHGHRAIAGHRGGDLAGVGHHHGQRRKCDAYRGQSHLQRRRRRGHRTHGRRRQARRRRRGRRRVRRASSPPCPPGQPSSTTSPQRTAWGLRSPIRRPA